MSIKACLSKIWMDITPGESVMIKTEVGEVRHTLNSNGHLVPFGTSEHTDLRERAAIAAMQGMLTDFPVRQMGVQIPALLAVQAADALISELKKEGAK